MLDIEKWGLFLTELQRELYPLKGKWVFITGVSRRKGIGYAIARQVAAWGASVAIHHFKPHDEEQPWGSDNLEDVLAGINDVMHEEAELFDVHGDFLDGSTPEKVIQAVVKKAGTIDALVCNHALSGSDGELGDLTADMLDRHWMINTRATILLAQAFAKQHELLENRGNIIFMTSGQSLGPMGGEVAYASSKGALAEITTTIADQLADQNIAVNTVNPGPVDTGYMTEEIWQAIKPKFPFGRFGQPEDPARLIAWLLTEEASWITGQVIHTEGGFGRWR